MNVNGDFLKWRPVSDLVSNKHIIVFDFLKTFRQMRPICFLYRGTGAEGSEALLLREKINETQKIPDSPPPWAILKNFLFGTSVTADGSLLGTSPVEAVVTCLLCLSRTIGSSLIPLTNHLLANVLY